MLYIYMMGTFCLLFMIFNPVMLALTKRRTILIYDNDNNLIMTHVCRDLVNERGMVANMQKFGYLTVIQ